MATGLPGQPGLGAVLSVDSPDTDSVTVPRPAMVDTTASEWTLTPLTVATVLSLTMSPQLTKEVSPAASWHSTLVSALPSLSSWLSSWWLSAYCEGEDCPAATDSLSQVSS